MIDGVISLAEAQDMIRAGAAFHEAFLRTVWADGQALREWYLREPSVPNLAARGAVVPAIAAADQVRQAREEGWTGDSCVTCGSMKVKRNGSCAVCCECGSTTGCS